LVSVGGTGNGPGVIQNFVSQDNQPLNSNASPATPGQLEIMWATGLGPIKGSDATAPPVGTLSTQVEVFVGGISATVVYAGRSGCCSAEDQIVFQVPSNAPVGCWVPVYIRTGGATLSNAVTMAISSDGSPCSEPSNPLAATFVRGGKIGTIRLFRASTHEDVGVRSTVDVANDSLIYDFAQAPPNPFAYGFLFSQPPAGTCNLLLQQGDYWIGSTPKPPSPPHRFNPGSAFTLGTAQGPRSLTIDPSLRSLFLGTYAPVAAGLSNTLVLNPGTYLLSAAGGPDVGAFQAQMTIPAALNWTNRDQISPVNRANPLTLAWSGLNADQNMAILGGNVDLPTNSSAIFYCIAPAGSSSFTIPAAILSAVPATRANPLRSKSAIYLFSTTLPNGSAITVPGIDAALAIAGHMLGKTVMFQ